RAPCPRVIALGLLGKVAPVPSAAHLVQASPARSSVSRVAAVPGDDVEASGAVLHEIEGRVAPRVALLRAKASAKKPMDPPRTRRQSTPVEVLHRVEVEWRLKRLSRPILEGLAHVLVRGVDDGYRRGSCLVQ